MTPKSIKKIALLSLAAMVLVSVTSAGTFTYTNDNTTVFPNPERGWHHRVDILGKTGDQLRSQFQSLKNGGDTLLHSYIKLDSYKGTDVLPDSYLNNLGSVLSTVRSLNMKIILRPAYSQVGGGTNVPEARILQHINQINGVISRYTDCVMSLEAGYVGPWGEWHTDSVADYSSQTAANSRYRIIKRILDTTNISGGVTIPVELRYPVLLREVLTMTPPSGSAALTQQERDRLGHHNDCFLYNATDRGTYGKGTWMTNFSGIAVQQQYVFDMLTSTGGNKMMGGETCDGNGRNDSGAVTVQNEMRDLNFTEINVDFWSGAINLWKAANLAASGNDPAETAYKRLSRKMGYRLRMVDATFPTAAAAGGTFAFSANLFNDGYASPIKSRKVVLVLSNASERWEYVLIDPATSSYVEANRWVSGAIGLNPNTVQLDSNMPAGTYKLALRLPDNSNASTYSEPELAIRFANPGIWDSAQGDNVLHQTITITNGGVLPPTVTVSATDAIAGEPADNGTFTFTRTGSTAAALTVNFTVGGTATSGTDYTALGTSVTIPAGQASATKTVTVIDDTNNESTETVIVTLASNAAYSIGSPSSDTVNIADCDCSSVVTVSATAANASEPATNGAFTFTRVGSTTAALTVNFALSGTATNGSDYSAIGTSVTFAAGQSSATQTVTVLNDSVLELGGETVIATLTNGAGYTLGSPSSGTVTIADDEVPPATVTVSATTANASEPASNGVFTFSRTGSTTAALTVNFAVSGTATNGTDYTTIGTSVTFAVGQSSTTQTVAVLSDVLVEASETVIVTLVSGAGYTSGSPSSATVTIANALVGGLPSPWVTADIGAVGATGSATYADPVFTVKGSGADILGTADEFRYVSQSSSGDCSIVVRVASIQNTNAWAKAGAMIRENTAANSRNLFVFVTPTNGVAVTWRSATNGTTNNTTPAVAGQTAPKWLKITRVGNVFTAFRSNDGITWTQVGTAQTITMAASATLGLAVTSHADGTLCTSTMDNVAATP